MKLTFLGATDTVTGSKFLLTVGAKKILVDCGLYQGLKELRLRNWSKFPIDPKDIDAVFLTHAHIDHSGYLPLLVKNGFEGPIYCTEGTRELASILLPDCGHLQEEEAEFANKRGYSKHKPALPLYTTRDGEYAIRFFKPVPYDAPFKLFGDLIITFLRAGHIIGSSFIHIKNQNISLLFTGDIGRMNDPIMLPPALVDQVDYLVMESTYGNRLHKRDHPAEQMGKIINHTAQRGGSVIIPAFAVGRAQSILYYIYLLKKSHKIPNIPVFLDSPMAIDATEIFFTNRDEHYIGKQECIAMCKTATYVNHPEDSKALDHHKFPMIIISASGMATGGRILYHLENFLPDSRSTILFTGYQAAGTRGDRLLSGESEIKIHGRMIPVKAEITELENTSAHADYNELLIWLSHFKRAPKKIFIVHGERQASQSFKNRVEAKWGWNCIVPTYMQDEELT